MHGGTRRSPPPQPHKEPACSSPLLKQTAPETRSNWMGRYCSLQLKTLSSLVAEVVWSAHSPLNRYSINILCQRHVPFHRRKARQLHRKCITYILLCKYSHPLSGAQDHIPLGSRVLVQSPCLTTLQMKRCENSFFFLSKNISFFFFSRHSLSLGHLRGQSSLPCSDLCGTVLYQLWNKFWAINK